MSPSSTPEQSILAAHLHAGKLLTWNPCADALLMCRVLQQASTDLAALSNRGYAHRKLGNFAAAAADYSAALKLSPSTVRLYNNRGYCLAKLGKYTSAIQDYQCVIELDPANAHAYHNRYTMLYDSLACCSCLLEESMFGAAGPKSWHPAYICMLPCVYGLRSQCYHGCHSECLLLLQGHLF